MPGQILHAEARYKADINSEFSLRPEDIDSYQKNGFVRLKKVLEADTLDHIKDNISRAVREADTSPLEEDNDYAKAFLQVMNLWRIDEGIREFCFGHKISKIASQLMKTSGVRMYHDQALYKEPHGGRTPWHCDQFYWPLDTNNTITAWIPLQPVPLEMGTLEFAAGTHKTDLGRSLGISGSNDAIIAAAVKSGSYHVERAPFEIGEISFHSGWTFHRADANSTDDPRQVMTIIMIDENAHLIEPEHDNHKADISRFLPGLKTGDLAASHLNPVLWSSEMQG